MKHILVPIGSTENSKNTLQYAIDFAKEIDAKLYIMRAYKMLSKAGSFVNADATMQRETNLYLRAMVESCDTKNVEVKLITAKGDVLDSINSINRELGIDLIVMGPKSNSIKDEVFLGKTSGSVVKQTEIPILIVPEGYKYIPVRRILTAFKSGVINTKNVLAPLEKIVAKFVTNNTLLLVKTPNYTSEDLILDPKLEAIKDNFITSENATTFQGVLENFKTQDPDMLCVFRRKRGFFKKLWESNTVLKKEFHCNVPLLILSGKK